MKKIINFKRLLKISKSLRRNKKTLVFTNGVFDILTIAHIRYLSEAKRHGDILLVGLNSDLSTRIIKGEDRPIVSQEQRAEILAQLPYVDFIYVFPQTSPLLILKALKPEVYIKGGDYKKKRSDKSGCREFVKSYGGKVILTKLTLNVSSSRIIEKIRNS